MLTFAHVERDTISFLGCRVLLEGHVHGYLNPVRRNRCSVCLPSLREYETAHLGPLACPKTSSAALSWQKRKKSEEFRTRQMTRRSRLENGASAWQRLSL